MTLAYFMFLTWLWKKFVCLYSDAFLYLFYENHKKIRWFEYELLCQKRIGRQPKLQLFHFSSSLILPSLIRLNFELSFFCEDTTVNMNYALCFISVVDEIFFLSYSILRLQAPSNSNFSLKGDLSIYLFFFVCVPSRRQSA